MPFSVWVCRCATHTPALVGHPNLFATNLSDFITLIGKFSVIGGRVGIPGLRWCLRGVCQVSLALSIRAEGMRVQPQVYFIITVSPPAYPFPFHLIEGSKAPSCLEIPPP